MKRFSWRLTILAAALAACTGIASAQTTNCSGLLAPGTYLNVTVPANTTCFLPRGGTVTVTNNVVVESGASLIMTLGDPPPLTFFVNGSLLGRDAATIDLEGVPPSKVTILGMVNLTGTTREVTLFDVSIGNILFIANSTGIFVRVAESNVGGSVLVRDNTTSQPILIEDNAIGGSLICLGNTPAPTSPLGPNTVGGGKAGQCASL